MKDKHRKYIIFCLVIFSVIIHSTQAKSWLMDEKDYTCVVRGELSATELKEIFELIINHDMLHSYFHFEIPDRHPLIVLVNECMTGISSLQVSGGEVVLNLPSESKSTETQRSYDDDNYENHLYFKEVEILGNQVTVVFQYPIEGIVGYAVLNKAEGVWQIINFSAPEY